MGLGFFQPLGHGSRGLQVSGPNALESQEGGRGRRGLALNLVAKRVEQKRAEIRPITEHVFGKAKPSFPAVGCGRLLFLVREGHVLKTQRLVGVGDDHVRRSGSSPRRPEPSKKVHVRFAAKVGKQIEDSHAWDGEFDQRVVALSLERHAPAPLDGLVGKVAQEKFDRVQVRVLAGKQEDSVVVNHLSQFDEAARKG